MLAQFQGIGYSHTAGGEYAHYMSGTLKISTHSNPVILLRGSHMEEITQYMHNNSCAKILTAISLVRAKHLNDTITGFSWNKILSTPCSDLQSLSTQVILSDTNKCSRDNAIEENGRQHCLDTRIQFCKITICIRKRLERDILKSHSWLSLTPWDHKELLSFALIYFSMGLF